MKKIVFLVLGLCSLIGFTQSDLGFQSYFVGAPGATHYKGEELVWEINVINNGTSSASVVDFKIFLSEDENLDLSGDIELKDGEISQDRFTNLIGLGVGDIAERKEFWEGYIRLPLDIEANKTYYFIFWIEQDIDNGETNISNNVVTQSVFVGLRDKLDIFPVDINALDDIQCVADNYELNDRTPLLLIHGWQPKGEDAEGNINIWTNFLRYFVCEEDLKSQYKPYYVKYNSNIVTVDDLGHQLRIELDDNYVEFHDREITIIAHSMGGLVSRSFLNRNRLVGPFPNQKGGERVDKLITLGTPHHGSPVANGSIVTDVSSYNYALFNELIFDLNVAWLGINYTMYGVFSIPTSTKVNRWDLRWDNYDDYFDYDIYPNEENTWLNGEKMNLDTTFDNKIIAYAGGLFDTREETNISDDLISKGYFKIEKAFKNLGHVNDGVVPFLSAIYQGHQLQEVRPFRGYYHDEIAKGRFDMLDANGLDTFLFDFLKQDLLDEIIDAQVLVSSNEVQYPQTALGNSSQQTITIQCIGDVPLNISSIQLVGSDNSQFSFTFPTVPFDIQPNQTQTFEVDFAPTSIGEKEVVFRINNSSANNPQLDIQLSGLAVETAETDYDTNTDPIYDFGDVYIYGGTELVTLTVSNSSSAPYTVADIDITGNDASLFTIVQQPELPKLFNPGDSETVIISFDPDSIGEKTATIEASFQDNTILDTADLIGNGVNTINNPNAPKLSSYEYWFNDDYFGRQTTSLGSNNSIESLNFDSSTSNISNGLNTFHFRVKDENGSWSSVLSEYVYVQNATISGANTITDYEYWFDNDYASRTTGNGDGTNPLILNLNIDVGTLDKGLHQFHIRFKDERGAWSSIVSEFVYNTTPEGLGSNAISAYRYWFNDDFENRVSETVGPDMTYMFLEDINISGLSNNTTNYIHFQFKDIYNNWSSVLTEEFLFATLNIDDANAERLKLHPNPSNSIIFIELEFEDGQLTIYDNLGKLVKEYSSLPAEVDISHFENGLYFFQLKTDDKIYQEKVIKF
ncbi:choice-of-anchor D domain-containing protein [Winogradskyella sp.]|uniref:choice-of-anchor D domain-containing protein n=1 Tax=Winogradskyella sp. TaxID=1883156 RepID=UPI0026314DB0|nr:choice-of-anchor D domain-containing protein [Winogradskyella sp.]